MVKSARMAAVVYAVLFGIVFLPWASPQPRQGGTIRMALWFDLTHLNPFLDNRSTDNAVRSVIFEGLVDWDKDLTVVPCIAESWTISKDGKVYTFKIRKGVKFHDGKDLTSEDVRWSLEYILDPKNAAYRYSNLRVIDAVEAPDLQTIRVKLKAPSSPLLSDIGTSHAPITPKGSVTELRPKTFPAGTGPFESEEWRPGQYIRLRKNPNYWQKGIPRLDGALIRAIPDEQIRYTALRSGDVDMVERIPYREGDEIRKGAVPGLGLSMGEAAGHYRLRLNLRRPPLNDLRVRQAIAFALDKQEIMQAATWGLGKTIYWRYPRNTRWFIEMEDRKQDFKKARALLEEAGHGRGLRMSLPLHVASLPAGQVVKAQLGKIGIDVDLQTMDRGAYRDRIRKREYDIVVSGGSMAPDPDSLLYNDFYSKFIDDQNESGYQNAEMDRLLEEGRTIFDFDKRKAIYTNVLRILMRDVPEIPLYTHPFIFGFRTHVKGFEAEEASGVLGYNSSKGGLPVTWLEK